MADSQILTGIYKLQNKFEALEKEISVRLLTEESPISSSKSESNATRIMILDILEKSKIEFPDKIIDQMTEFFDGLGKPIVIPEVEKRPLPDKIEFN